jgi:hypothetical protein
MKAAVVLVLGSAALLGGTQSARADNFITRYQSAETKLCLDGSPGSDYVAHPQDCNGGAFQKWEWLPLPGSSNTGQLRQVATQGCLDTVDDVDRKVVISECGPGTYQQWTRNDDTWVSKRYNECLDGNSTRIYLHACNGGNWQNWYIHD